jgi:hypothetical protein
MSATPRHRDNVERSKTEAALLPGDPPVKMGRRDRARAHHRAQVIAEVCAYVRSLGEPGTKVGKGAETIAKALEQHFAPAVMP